MWKKYTILTLKINKKVFWNLKVVYLCKTTVKFFASQHKIVFMVIGFIGAGLFSGWLFLCPYSKFVETQLHTRQ
jgi:hypothetical protein